MLSNLSLHGITHKTRSLGGICLSRAQSQSRSLTLCLCVSVSVSAPVSVCFCQHLPPFLCLNLFHCLSRICHNCKTREVGWTLKCGFGEAMLLVGVFYQVYFGRMVLPKWPLWAYLFNSAFTNVSELRRACFRQASVARAVLLPGAFGGSD